MIVPQTDRRPIMVIPSVFKGCHETCLGGGKCAMRAGIPHVYHACNNPKCACHSTLRWLSVRAERGASMDGI